METVKDDCSGLYEIEDGCKTDNSSQKKEKDIIINIIFSQLENKLFFAFDFWILLLKYKHSVDLSQIRSKDGYNLLHAIIAHNRLSFMVYLVYLGLWNGLMAGKVPEDSENSFRGHTPKQVAASKRSKKYRNEIEKNEKLVNSMSRFLVACLQGDERKVKEHLKQQPKVLNDRDSLKNNCLHWTIVSGNLDLFHFLLGQGADAQNVNVSKENLLHTASLLGRKEFINVLIKKCKVDHTLSCSNKRTPQERVAENGDVESLKQLFENYVLPTSCLLPFAAAHGRLNFIKFVLEESKRYIDVDSRDNSGRSALMKACEIGRLDIVKYLKSMGANFNAIDLRRRTAMHIAADSGQYNIVEFLINEEVDMNPQDCYTGSELCFLIRGKDKGKKAWHYVEVRRNVVDTFLKKTKAGQVDVALYGTLVKSGWGEDPEKSVVEGVEKMFAERRNKPNVPPDVSPLHLSIYREHPEVARLLIKSGANIQIADQFQMTPMMYCALRNDLKTAQLLEEKGADLNATDFEGKTALDIAKINENKEIENFLEGKRFIELATKFADEAIAKLTNALNKENLEQLRKSGADVRKHNIDVLREAQIDINILLVDLGSGPIMKASGESAEENIDSGYHSASSSLCTNSSRSSSSGWSYASNNSVHSFSSQSVNYPSKTSDYYSGSK